VIVAVVASTAVDHQANFKGVGFGRESHTFLFRLKACPLRDETVCFNSGGK
jgi:hypothetical protein